MSGTATSDVLVNTLKTLAIDAIQKANSGHPGMPMGMADAASVLWADFLTVDPSDPDFVDRDRFVLSAGHGSMLLYGLLHLAGFEVSLEDLKAFRQLGSITPGHPEAHITPGVETTTGPLGQGFATAVGMAMAEARLAARYNRPGFEVVDHWTYGICGDGDLMEGVAQEAASLAGHLGLGKLVFLYDDNGITIEGGTALAFSEDVPGRFRANGWHVVSVDGHDRAAVAEAIRAARAEPARPSLVCCKTHIGHGSPNKHDTCKVHGSPLGEEEIRLTKAAIGWPAGAHFLVPDDAVAAFDALRARGAQARTRHAALMERYRAAHPALAAELDGIYRGDGLPEDLEALVPDFADAGPMATRATSGQVINAIAAAVPQLWGGSADLAGSTKTMVSGAASFSKQAPGGRNLHFGIREHAMAAALNGMALHGGVIPYGGTFLTFSDYMRGAMRLSALMGVRAIYVLTHDSVLLGEDGPTHQSVEHAMALRTIPNLRVLRPADGRETSAAWLAALRRVEGPTALLLTRQRVPQIPGTEAAMAAVDRGAYVVKDCDGPADIVLIGTGSELHLCTAAADTLAARGVAARVVSMLSLDSFLAQPEDFQDEILSSPKRLSVEAGRTFGWAGVVGPFGASLGVDRFGDSAPAEVLADLYAFTVEGVVERAEAVLGGFEARAAKMRAALGS